MRPMFIALLLVVAVAAPAHAATKTVTASGFNFSPSAVAGPAGTTIKWVQSSGTHNVVSRTAMFSSGSAAATSWPYTRTFSAGTFGYYCEVHGTGMSGTVRVKPRMSWAPDGKAFTVRWASSATNTGSAFSVQYRVSGGDWKTWRSTTSSTSGVFGKGGAPVSVVAGRTYGFRVRSLNNGKASGYSPVRSFTP